MEDRRGKDDEMSRGMWKKVENGEANEARIAEAKRKRRKREEETDNRRREDDSEISGRKRGRRGRGRFDRAKGDRRYGSTKVS